MTKRINRLDEGLDKGKEEERRKMLAVVPSLISPFPHITHKKLGDNMRKVIGLPEFKRDTSDADHNLRAAQNGKNLDLPHLTKNFKQLIQGLA